MKPAIYRVLYDAAGNFRPPDVMDNLPSCIEYLSDCYGQYTEQMDQDIIKWLDLAIPLYAGLTQYVDLEF